jgi:hypothetical protein
MAPWSKYAIHLRRQRYPRKLVTPTPKALPSHSGSSVSELQWYETRYTNLQYTIQLGLKIDQLAPRTTDHGLTASMTLPLTFKAPVMKAFWPLSFPSANWMNVSVGQLLSPLLESADLSYTDHRSGSLSRLRSSAAVLDYTS